LPEAIGVALIAVTFLSAVFALAAFHRPEVERASSASFSAPVPLTEDALRRVLRDLDVRFQYNDQDAVEDVVELDGAISGSRAPAVRVSQGDGAITLSLRESDARSIVRAAGFGAPRLPKRSALGTWAATAAIAYALSLYYFTTAYPALRRRGVA
jgi:hypothetical protein